MVDGESGGNKNGNEEERKVGKGKRWPLKNEEVIVLGETSLSQVRGSQTSTVLSRAKPTG